MTSDPRGYGPRLAAAEREAWRIYRGALERADRLGSDALYAEAEAARAQWERCRDDLALVRAEGVAR